MLNEVGNEDRQAGCRVHLILIINSSLHPPFTPGPPPSISATKIKLGQRFKELPENISHPKLNQLDLRIIKKIHGTLLCSFSAIYGVYMTRIASSWNYHKKCFDDKWLDGLLGWWVGSLVGWMGGWLVGWQLGWFVGWLVGW